MKVGIKDINKGDVFSEESTSFKLLPNIEKCSPSWGGSLDKFEQSIREDY